MTFYDNMDTVMRYFTTNGAFLSVCDGDLTNTMTVSWGYFGYMWAAPYVMVMVRPQRYTHKLLEKADSFTLSVPFGTMKNELVVCGTKSGLDTDKSKIVEFVPSQAVKSPVVGGCDAYYECKIIYRDAFKGENIPGELNSRFYTGDFHSLYFGEIVKCYGKAE